MKEGITSTKSASRICYETPWLALSGRGCNATLELSSSAVELRSLSDGAWPQSDHRLQSRFPIDWKVRRKTCLWCSSLQGWFL